MNRPERKRKLGDSNPRYGNPYGSLANCWFQPLTQTSLGNPEKSIFSQMRVQRYNNYFFLPNFSNKISKKFLDVDISSYLCTTKRTSSVLWNRIKALLRSAAGPSVRLDERKVRAAQGTPLLKVEAVGDGWLGEKKITARFYLDHGKGEKVCVRDHQAAGNRRAVPTGGCKFM